MQAGRPSCLIRVATCLSRSGSELLICKSSAPRRSASRSSKHAHVHDAEIARLAAIPVQQLQLSDLTRHGPCPLSQDALVASANFTLETLPVWLAHRIDALRSLPFIVMRNAHISQIYKNYQHSLSILMPFMKSRIRTAQEEADFTTVLGELVQTHANTIPVLARGFVECSNYISKSEVTKFLDKHLRTRIGTRLVAEQHIALHFETKDKQAQSANSSYIGVVDTQLVPASIVRQCAEFVSEICELKYGVRPRLELDGEPEARFAFIPSHLEYIMTELLKNSFRATIESGNEREPVVVTIAKADDAEDTPPALTIRVRDQGGGISKDVLPDIWTYNFTTFSPHDLPGGKAGADSTQTIDALNAISGATGQGSSIAGLGYGLPLSRAYAEYFGGGISVQSLYGWGTDVYLKLKGV